MNCIIMIDSVNAIKYGRFFWHRIKKEGGLSFLVHEKPVGWTSRGDGDARNVYPRIDFLCWPTPKALDPVFHVVGKYVSSNGGALWGQNFPVFLFAFFFPCIMIIIIVTFSIRRLNVGSRWGSWLCLGVLFIVETFRINCQPRTSIVSEQRVKNRVLDHREIDQ